MTVLSQNFLKTYVNVDLCNLATANLYRRINTPECWISGYHCGEGDSSSWL